VSDRHNLRQMLIRHEGVRLKPYRCTAGKLTIGVGRNLDDVGITQFEAMGMLTHDMERVTKEAVDTFPWFQSLSVVRQDVVLNMLFNLGLARFREFKRMISAISRGAFAEAAKEMLESKWATQVGERATELARMMERDIYV
jgi:lysozyme